jgi:hypothetical protein
LVLAVTRPAYPLSELTALLDALERSLLAAHAEEVRDAWRETGRARNIACQEVRALLNEAIAASDDGFAATPPPDACSGLDRLIGVSRTWGALPSWRRRCSCLELPPALERDPKSLNQKDIHTGKVL